MRYGTVFSLGATIAVFVGCSSVTAQPLTISAKERVLAHDMATRFVIDGQAMCKLRKPVEEKTYNMPDNAYMTGIYLGTLAMKYDVTKDAAVKTQAAQSVQALDLLCTISGKPGLLARAAIPVDAPFQDDGEWHVTPDGSMKWRGDVSSDQMDGVFFGFALAYDLVADDREKAIIKRNVAALTDHLLMNGLRIIDVDNEPTQWGNYTPEYVKRREPMNALVLLQHLKVAAHVTGDAKYEQAYKTYAVDQGYADVAVRARMMADPVAGRVNHSDDVMLFLAYLPLLRLEQDPALRQKYLDSLERSWMGDDGWPGWSPEGNPLYAFTVSHFLENKSGVEAAVQTLRWFPLDIKWDKTTIAAYEKELDFKFDPAIASPEPQPGKPYPVDRRPRTWSTWVQDPYRGGTRDDDSAEGMEFNGHDYLLGYWLGRFTGNVEEGI